MPIFSLSALWFSEIRRKVALLLRRCRMDKGSVVVITYFYFFVLLIMAVVGVRKTVSTIREFYWKYPDIARGRFGTFENLQFNALSQFKLLRMLSVLIRDPSLDEGMRIRLKAMQKYNRIYYLLFGGFIFLFIFSALVQNGVI